MSFIQSACALRLRGQGDAIQQDFFELDPISSVIEIVPGIQYHTGVLDRQRAAFWFDSLLHDVNWGAYHRVMYGREILVPRLIANYMHGVLKDQPQSVMDAFEIVRSLVGVPFNTVSLNLYRDEKDSVAPHGDKVHKLVADQPIAILSLGAPRRMSLREKKESARNQYLEVEPGSVLIMSYDSQTTHVHGIPKQNRACGPRISLAFRCGVA
jgi:alkylated DNA repair dioxygenase AlkB